MMELIQPILFKKYRLEVLRLLLLNPADSYHVREIARLTDTVAGTLHKELRLLADAGILSKDIQGNQTRYAANNQCVVFSELCALLKKLTELDKTNDIAALRQINLCIDEISLNIGNKIQLSRSKRRQIAVRKQLDVIDITIQSLSSRTGFTLENIEAMMKEKNNLQLDTFWQVWTSDFVILQNEIEQALLSSDALSKQH